MMANSGHRNCLRRHQRTTGRMSTVHTESPLGVGPWRPNEQGLVAAIAVDKDTGEVLMLAWMNAESLKLTVESGFATYWSRSRAQLWRKGETSGHLQRVSRIRVDCDGDALLLEVEQMGAACHTGSRSCFDTAQLTLPESSRS